MAQVFVFSLPGKVPPSLPHLLLEAEASFQGGCQTSGGRVGGWVLRTRQKPCHFSPVQHPITDPWKMAYLNLHKNHKYQPNRGKYTIHGSHGNISKRSKESFDELSAILGDTCTFEKLSILFFSSFFSQVQKNFEPKDICAMFFGGVA